MHYFKHFYYETTDETAARWGMSRRRVQELLNTGRIDDAILIGNTWLVSNVVTRPPDMRRKTQTAPNAGSTLLAGC